VNIKFFLGTLPLSILVGCGGGANEDSKPPIDVEEIPQLNDISVSAAPLIKASEFKLSQNLKNGMFKSYQNRLSHLDGNENNAINTPTISADSQKSFSQTNTQEQTVDEADRIKYNGEYLFIAANSFNDIDHNSSDGENYLRIMKRNTQGEMKQVKALPYSSNSWSEQQLYLHSNTLAVLDYSSSYFTFGLAEPSMEGSNISPKFYYGDSEFELSFIDVSDPSQATITKQFTIEGGLIDSRVIGSNLYLISNYHPNFEEFDNSDNSDATVLANYNKLNAAQLASLTPNITDATSQESNELVTPSNCYISSDATDKDGFDSLFTITKINLTNPEQRESLCVNTSIYGIYASENALYTHGTVYQNQEVKTVIHKFSLSGETMSYAATGAVEGHMGWGHQNLRFSEYNNDLRVISTTNMPYDENAGFSPFKHQLFMLEQQNNNLVKIAQLPNDTHPTPIGKSNEQGLVDEDIYAVRFAGDKAFVVTFRQIDPFYVIDLKDKTAPKIAGELEIPGYSAYLHPVSDSLVLGIGQNIQDWRDPSAQEVENGSKVSLFDISDVTEPKLVNEKVFSNAYTPAEWDYKSLSFLSTNSDQLRFTMPIEKWTSVTDDGSLYQWKRLSELAVFEIDVNSTPSLNYIGSSKVDFSGINAESVPYVWGGNDRSVIHNDDLYYIHGNYIWHSLWQSPSENKGPF